MSRCREHDADLPCFSPRARTDRLERFGNQLFSRQIYCRTCRVHYRARALFFSLASFLSVSFPLPRCATIVHGWRALKREKNAKRGATACVCTSSRFLKRARFSIAHWHSQSSTMTRFMRSCQIETSKQRKKAGIVESNQELSQ